MTKRQITKEETLKKQLRTKIALIDKKMKALKTERKKIIARALTYP